MAMQVPQVTTQANYTTEEYLELEAQAEQRSEYINGQIIPMAGGKINHNKIALNLSSSLNFSLRDRNTRGNGSAAYEVFMSDLRLWIPECCLYTYPDVMMASTPLIFAEGRKGTVVNPLMIAEVLSDSTEKYDRGDKFRMYRTIPGFKEYLLISQTAMQVEKFTKNAADQWVLSEYATKESKITFDSFEFGITLSELYDRVKFD